MKLIIKFFILAVVNISLSGCGTLMSIKKGDITMYAGFDQDFCLTQGFFISPFVFDIIPTAIADTALLPITSVGSYLDKRNPERDKCLPPY